MLGGLPRLYDGARRGGILGERLKGLENGGGGVLGLVGGLLGGDLCILRGEGLRGRRDCESRIRLIDPESGHHEAFHLHRT